ncbi:uncharacterized protein ISCGN_010057 [Ixodes scapularis]
MKTRVLACLIVCAITRTLGHEGASNASVSLGSLSSTASRLSPIKNGAKASDKRFGNLTNTSSGDIAIQLNEITCPSVRRIVVTDIAAGGHRMVEAFLDKTEEKATACYCNIIGDRALIEEIMQYINKDIIEKTTKERVQYYLNLCNSIKSKRDKGSLESLFERIAEKLQRLFIFPGTKWCGAGDVAKEYSDLGVHKGTDMCCRTHDISTDNIPALQTKHGITNNNFYTMTNCKDDRNFYNCLSNDNSDTSIAVRTIFFEILSVECFSCTYPRKCVKNNPSHNPSKCKKYELVKSAPKKCQILPPSYFKDNNNRKRSQKNQVRLTIAENDPETVTENAGVWVKTEEPENKPVLENENYFGNLVEGDDTTPVISEEPVNN